MKYIKAVLGNSYYSEVGDMIARMQEYKLVTISKESNNVTVAWLERVVEDEEYEEALKKHQEYMDEWQKILDRDRGKCCFSQRFYN